MFVSALDVNVVTLSGCYPIVMTNSCEFVMTIVDIKAAINASALNVPLLCC